MIDTYFIDMLLENKYYRIADRQGGGENAVFRIVLLPDSDIYRGHFPGNPVCPGVCNIGIIKECVMLMTGSKLFIRHIKQCRLTAVATPTVCPELEVTVNVTPAGSGYAVTAIIADTQRTYMEYKGEMAL